MSVHERVKWKSKLFIRLLCACDRLSKLDAILCAINWARWNAEYGPTGKDPSRYLHRLYRDL
jgi:hypothetical protein